MLILSVAFMPLACETCKSTAAAPAPQEASAVATQPRTQQDAQSAAKNADTVQKQLPDLSLPDQNGEAFALSELKGHYSVVYFYPKNGTPGCTVEARTFRDAHGEFEQINAQVIGVSRDDAASHATFADEEKLPFRLLADVDGKLANALGVGSMFGMTERVTFLAAPNLSIIRVFDDVNPSSHASEVLAAIKAHAAASS